MTSLESRLEVQGRLRAASAYLGGQPGWRSRPNLGRACSSTASTSTTGLRRGQARRLQAARPVLVSVGSRADRFTC